MSRTFAACCPKSLLSICDRANAGTRSRALQARAPPPTLSALAPFSFLVREVRLVLGGCDSDGVYAYVAYGCNAGSLWGVGSPGKPRGLWDPARQREPQPTRYDKFCLADGRSPEALTLEEVCPPLRQIQFPWWLAEAGAARSRYRVGHHRRSWLVLVAVIPGGHSHSSLRAERIRATLGCQSGSPGPVAPKRRLCRVSVPSVSSCVRAPSTDIPLNTHADRCPPPFVRQGPGSMLLASIRL